MSTNNYTILNSPALRHIKIACLTLDVEKDYGDLLDQPSYEGVEHIPELVSFFRQKQIPLTCFIQGSLFETHSDKIGLLTELDTELELHSYSHPRPRQTDTRIEVEKGKEAYQKFLGKEPLGYRSPLGVVNDGDYQVLVDNGFKFDSSVFPSLRPGTFNNLSKPNKPFYVNTPRIIEFPFTVFSEVIRIPIALSYIKLLGKPYFYLLKACNLPGLIVFDFHLHDLFKLNSADKIPMNKHSLPYRLIFRRIYQKYQDGLNILDKLITILEEKGYSFQKLIDVYEAVSK